MKTLRTAGYVRQGQDLRYQLSSKMLFLTRNFQPAEHLRDAAHPAAVRMSEEFQETVHVAAIDTGEIVFVDFLESPHAVRILLPTVPAPLHLTAIGRAILSHLPEPSRTGAIHESAFAAGVSPEDADTKELRSSLELATRREFATYVSDDDVVRVAVAILSESGEPIGGISISGPAYRIGDRLDDIGDRLVIIAAKIKG